MKYRDAITLKEGDQVIKASDKAPLIVSSIELFGQFKVVKIYYVDNDKVKSVFNTEII